MVSRSVLPYNENTLHYNIQKLSLLNNSLVYRGLHDVITVFLLLIAPGILYSETAAYKSRCIVSFFTSQSKSSLNALRP
jgi:hypothetical protein